MSVQLVGRNNDIADVNKNGLQLIESLSMDPMSYYAEKGQAALWTSTYSATGGEEVIYIQNTDPRKLRLKQLMISTTVVSLFTLFKVTSTIVAGGTAVTPVNLDLGGGSAGLENSFGDASVTGSLLGDTIFVGSMAVVKRDYLYPLELVLNENDAVALTLTTTGVPQVQVKGYWA